jgi:hypothetical protein
MSIPTRTLDELFAVCRFMSDFPGPWWVGGGWAIDAWAGGPSREHEDIEICVRRQEQQAIHAYCAGWQFFTPVDNQWAPMAQGELLEFPRFMLQLQRTPDTVVTVAGMPPTFEFLLNDETHGEWIFRDDPRVHMPLDRVYGPTPLGVLAVVPAILLLHKAFTVYRAKDDHDFRRIYDHLTIDQRGWLKRHLDQMIPEHRWLPLLS